MTTEVIVTEVNNTVVLSTEDRQIVVAGMIGPASTTLKGLGDIDISDLTTGSLLVYNVATQKWTATTKLENQVFESGQF